TSAQISVSSSVDWTASSDNAAFTVSPASGSGNGTITVNFEANTTEASRSAVITVSTTSDKVSTKSYTVTITQKAPSTGDEYTSNVTWTLGTNAYDKTSSSSQNGTVNGVELDNILKLGTSKAAGDATIKLPAGTSKVVFYCIGWNKAADPVVKFTLGETTKEITVKANTTLAGNPPYTLTVTDSDRYQIDLGTTLSAEMSVKVETLSASPRVAFFGIQAK
ncbi:MAG: BACON domain-containing protein, partial [Bacteroidales bacterium]|nr:BACON domain-containing protein [Bacteroidales bacterium]